MCQLEGSCQSTDRYFVNILTINGCYAISCLCLFSVSIRLGMNVSKGVVAALAGLIDPPCT